MEYGWVYFIVLLYIGLCRRNVSNKTPFEYVPKLLAYEMGDDNNETLQNVLFKRK